MRMLSTLKCFKDITKKCMLTNTISTLVISLRPAIRVQFLEVCSKQSDKSYRNFFVRKTYYFVYKVGRNENVNGECLQNNNKI